ncbi:MAG: Na+/H+ antiporter NhaC family protein [Muribaculaceae bacterium]|nr:Na+/H+ antiporter NhaC family protein [Muribaculaceae bacterium]
MTQGNDSIPNRRGLLALSPAFVFLILYVVVSLVIGDFYVMPITVALLAASVWGIIITRGLPLGGRIEAFSKAAAHSNILYMVWIFVLAGSFAALAKGIGAIDATVALTLNFFPASFLLPAIFAAACFISMSIGTSVGTVVALVPLIVELAHTGGANIPLYVATALGGAFFGDNLSFISDTTIAATRTQGCNMADKFNANFRIVLPAALITLALYIMLGHEVEMTAPASDNPWWLVIPYLVIIVVALCGINVTVVLLLGIVCSMLLGLFRGVGLLDQCRLMGEGIDSMGNLIIITLLASGMLGLIKNNGGIDYLLQRLTRNIHGSRGAQGCIAVLVGLVNLCTANNTVAILTVGSISKNISTQYGIAPRKTASLLDTASCIVQCLIPYGAQTLLATGLAGISPASPWPYLYYPWALTVCLIISIIVKSRKNAA